VADGQLTLRLADLGGSDPFVVIESLQITNAPPPSGTFSFDFGAASSNVAAGYTQVTDTSAFSSFAGYGSPSGTLYTYAPGVGTALTRALVYTADAAFAVNIANGPHPVTITLGDVGPYQHDQMGVYLEGAQVDSVSTAAGQTVTRTYTVSVTDGQLTLRLRD